MRLIWGSSSNSAGQVRLSSAAQARVIAATSIDNNAKLLAEHVRLLARGAVPRLHHVETPEPVAAQAEDPDAALLDLGRQFRDVLAQMNETSDEEECARLDETRLKPLEEVIEAARPTTLAGLAVQAGIFADGSQEVVHADTKSTIAASVLRLTRQAAHASPGCHRARPPSPFMDPDAELLRLNREYETWRGVYHAACDAQEAISRAANRPEWDRADIAVRQAIRRKKEVAILASSIAPKTPLAFGLRARLVAAQLADWWDDDDELDRGEIACRTFLDQLIGPRSYPAAGCSPEEILAYTRPEKV